MTVSTADLTSREAWQLLTDEPDASLIDVPTDVELSYVDAPDVTPMDRTGVRLVWAPPGKDFAARFDGPPYDDSHRGVVSGWKASGLPWSQT